VNLYIDLWIERKVNFFKVGFTCFYFLSSFIFSNTSHAQDIAIKDSFLQLLDTNVLNPVVVTGQAERIKASESVVRYRVLQASTIKQMGAVNLSDVLSRQANIRLSNDNILGSSISLQNLSGQQIKFLLNGFPIGGRENGNINLDQINLEDIERIEIIEGPMSVIYGTDALGGVINIITKKPVLNKTLANAYVYNESIGHFNQGVGMHKPIGTKSILSANVSRNFFTGLLHEDTGRTHIWKPREQYFGAVGFYTEHKGVVWNYRSDLMIETIQNKGKVVINPVEAYAFDDYYHTHRGIHSLNTRFTFKNKVQVDLINGVSHYKRDKRVYRKDMQSLTQQLIENREENTSNLFVNAMSRAVVSNKKKGLLNYLVGYDFNYDLAIADRVEGNRIGMGDYAVFAMLEYNLSKAMKIRPGLRGAYNTLFTAPLTPSLHWMWSPSSKWQMRASYGAGFRAPSLKEQRLFFVDLNHNVRGNPDLNAERSHTIQAGLDFKNYHQKLKLAYSFGLNSYFNSVSDMIGLMLVDKNSLLYTYANYGQFRGGGTLLEQKTYYKNWYMELALGGMLVKNMFSATVGKPYYYTPDVNLTMNYTLKKVKGKIGLFVKHNGKFINYIQNEQGEVSQFLSDRLTFVDLTYRHLFLKDKLSIGLGAKNMLNVRNIININPFNSFHASGNGMNLSPGRSLFVRISYAL
jgi:outer membrane receptor for ferrienterochelin and colicins